MTMRARRAPITALLAFTLTLAGCGGSTPSAPVTPAATSAVTDASGAPPAPDAGSAAPSVDPGATASVEPDGNPVADALATHPWAAATLTDVTTGEPFTIASLGGRAIFVEAMAIWCTNCRAQQGRFTEALASLDPSTVAYVVLTIEPSETAEDLARYKDQRGFTGRYAVAGRDVSAALETEFGPNVLNPPTVPLILISPTGDVSFHTGGESVDDIIKIAGA
jgi:thiol-disulfide isomerase/thioredoxin